MTRRGSIAYYMSAAVLGSMFVSATFWLYHDVYPDAYPEPLASDFLGSYFRAMAVNLVPLLLAAFVLRRVAVLCHWKQAWAWLVAGAVVFVLVQWILAVPIRRLPEGAEIYGWRGILIGIVSYGPSLLLEKPVWLWPIPGLATSYVLFLAYRAFELQPFSDA